MKPIVCCGLIVGLAAVVSLRAEREKPKETAEGNIGHMVYFTLKDNSAEAKQKLSRITRKNFPRSTASW